MQLLRGLVSLKALPERSALSVGNYDGVHLGHQHIIQTMRRITPAAPAVVVVTFEPHPLSVLRPDLAPPRLTSNDLKRDVLAAAGVTHLIELEPTAQVLDVSAEEFWRRLRDEAAPAHLVEGPDFNFGKAARGNVAKLREWTRDSGVDLTIVEPLEVRLPGFQVVPVSSSLIRWLVANGRVTDAAACLGRPYTLRGRVTRGYRRGRTIGFPTANLDVGEQLVPADGVYAGRMQIAGRCHPAAVSIGTSPTFEKARRQIEAHVLEFSGDLYGATLDLELIAWVRDQIRFPNVERLIERMNVDIARFSA